MSTASTAGAAAGDDAPGGRTFRALEGDPGVQRERTALAWQRTALGAAGVTLACALAWARTAHGGVAPAVVGLVAVVVVLTRIRVRRPTGPPWVSMVGLGALVLVLAVLGSAVAVVNAHG